MEGPEEPKGDTASSAEILIVDTDSNAEVLRELREIKHTLKASHHLTFQVGLLAVFIAVFAVLLSLKKGSLIGWFFLVSLLIIAFLYFYDWYFEPEPLLRKEKRV